MKAQWSSVCPRCECSIAIGDEIKKQWAPTGVVDGKMTFKATGKMVHTACKKAKARPQPPERRFDPETGEILE